MAAGLNVVLTGAVDAPDRTLRRATVVVMPMPFPAAGLNLSRLLKTSLLELLQPFGGVGTDEEKMRWL